MTSEELNKKYPPPILWTEYRTSVEAVEKLWMTGTTTHEPGAKIFAHFDILFKDGTRKHFPSYEDADLLLKDVTAYLEELKKQQDEQHA